MGKYINLLVIAAIVSVGVSFADATSYSADTSDEYYDDSESSSEEDECQQKKCKKPNEVYDVCPASCPPRVCGIDDRLILCAPQPKPGDPNCNKPACRCKNGFYRDDKGNCVRWEQCQKKCKKPNEVYDVCPASCPPRVCGIDDRLILCAPQPKPGDPNCNKPACRCKNGFYRDDKGNCVRWEQCPKCPNPNEVYDQCFSPCLQRRCDYDPRRVLCAPPPKLGDPGCVAGCRCADGFVRNSKGLCVRLKECNKCSKRNEVYDQCFLPCLQATCEYTPRPELVKCACISGCRCSDGYVRNKDGDCIRKEECVKCSKRNEVYDQCFSPCLQRTCDYDSRLVKCAPPPKPGDPGCVAGCRCIDGYIRNRAGACIEREQCDTCRGDENAKPGCGVNCGKKCSDIGKKKPAPCLEFCLLDGCDCKPGFYYDENINKCVRPKECSPTCQANEVYSTCANGGCGKRKCTDLDKPDICIDPTVCKPGCVCADGFYRDAKGKCVTEKECRSQIGCGGDINAAPGCGVNCGKKCADYGSKGPFICPKICKVGGCDCKDGFYYDEVQKKCVRPGQCTRTCKANEVFVNCANGGCRRRKCTDIDGPILCIDPIKCEPGCICADGYYQDAKGNCVSKQQCQSQNAGCNGDKNAVPGCGVYCGQKCSDIGKPGTDVCPLICYLNACDCKKGYYYDEITKKCVLPEECTPQCKQNEELSPCANGICRPQDCKEKGSTIWCKPVAPGSCRPGCVCKVKHLRKSGVCVPQAECDAIGCGGDINAVPGCGVNCGQKCADYGLKGPFKCPKICNVGGCDCKDGFYYDEVQKKCVRPDQCSEACNGDKNAVPGCGVNCGQKCSDIGKPGTGICPLICYLNACDCKKGYYYDEITKKCVLPEECTPQCKQNEELSPCANGICRAQDCKEKGTIPLCPPMTPDSCRAGCVCKMNFLRKSGVCIPETECDANKPVTPTNGTSCENASEIVVRLRQGNYIINGKLLNQIMKLNPKQSVALSAFSTMTPLAQCLLYSKADTSAELLVALNVNTADEIRCAFRQFLDSIKAAKGTELTLAAKVYVKDTYQFSEPFKKDAKEVFNAEEESINFDNADNAANTINQWVSGATKGKITDLVKPDMFSSLTRFVLTNAIYFKGTWKTEFDPKDTKKADFYVDGQNTKQVDMMELRAKLNYNQHADLDAQTIELPFQDENISFVVILPNQNDGLLDLVDKLQDAETLDRAVSSFRSENVALFMPRMDISTRTDLIEALRPVGVKSLFTPGDRLQGIIVPDESLYVAIAVQRATITLDEKGAEAAAANAFIGTRSGPRIQEFRADHPYVYFIKVGKTPIFSGVYRG